jgi:hypothetical protein
MPTKTTKQEANSLITYFLKKYKDIYGSNPPGLNRYSLVFGFEALYLDYDAEAKSLIDYYFDAYEQHSPKYFMNKYGDIAMLKEDEEKDAVERKRLYDQTVKMVREKRKAENG